MVHLQDNPFSSDSVTLPNSKSAYKRRKLFKICVRASLICALGVVCYFFGRSVQWGALKDTYGFDPRDVDFVQYFCSNNGQPIAASDSLYDKQLTQQKQQDQQQESGHDLLEHVRAGYLDYEIAPDTSIPNSVWNDLPVKGAYYMVVRNEQLQEARAVIKSMEDHMVNGTSYPWVFLNNQHFTKEFRTYIKQVTKAPVFFGKIDLEAWEYPHWIDVPRAEYLMLEQEMNMVHKGSSLSYHQMLRYHSGFFFHHPLLRNVEYTWRVETGSDYSCQMDEDMFLSMKEQKKSLGMFERLYILRFAFLTRKLFLGFVLTMKEAAASIPTLWTRVNEFKDLYAEHVLPEDQTIFPWIYDPEEDNYNLCHFWSNFQLVDLSFFRSEAYQKYFEYLDNTGNFFYERLVYILLFICFV